MFGCLVVWLLVVRHLLLLYSNVSSYPFLSFGICFTFYTLIDVTPFRFLVGLSGPSPLFPEGLFKPSPLFRDGVKFCKPRCGMNVFKGEEEEENDGGDGGEEQGGEKR
mgnify:CR=1 FL=1